MPTFIDEILLDIDWRLSELAKIKIIPIRYKFSPEHKDLQIRYSIPAIYALWEGYIKESLSTYSNYLNMLNIKRNDISLPLLAHQLDSLCDFNTPRVNFDSKQRITKIIDGCLKDVIIIRPNVPTKSNINFKVLNNILERFCIPSVNSKYESKLDKLLYFRNGIAHGEKSLSVDMSQMVEFIDLVENLMFDVVINIEIGQKEKSYQKDLS